MKYFSLILLLSWCIKSTAQQKLQHISSAQNIGNNSTFINAEGLNNNPGAIIIVEYDAATAKANPHAVGVWYDGTRWAVFNQDRAAMPGGGLSVERTWLQQNKIKNLAIGFRLTPAQYNELDCPDYGIGKGDCPAERKAAYMCVHGEGSVQQNWKDGRTMELYRVVKPIYELWMQFENGPNEPLRRSYAYSGGRDFDFNLDGLAHYGMLPDLIQDLKNQGFTAGHLKPLFLATEQYLLLWEKAEAVKNYIRN